jgi:hypothetical protein
VDGRSESLMDVARTNDECLNTKSCSNIDWGCRKGQLVGFYARHNGIPSVSKLCAVYADVQLLANGHESLENSRVVLTRNT